MYRCAAAIAAFLIAGLAWSQPNEPLKVLLQGESAAALAELVKREGGTVTHHLHIIDAVGALLTRQQLDNALRSPLITRYLDDLSITDPPQEELENTSRQCSGRGALELDRNRSSVTWRLYNKQVTALALRGLELAWPPRLGKVSAITLDGVPLDHKAVTASEPGVFKATFKEESAPPIATPSALTLNFDVAPGGAAANAVYQREYNFTAAFDGNCRERMIPGYDDNEGDSYYPQVVGATDLHRHGVTGRGVTVAVLDSGLWEHQALARDTQGNPRVVARFDAIRNIESSEVFDESGHGTHLTSALANSEPVTRDGAPTGSFKGIAPDAHIIPVKAFNDQGQGDFLDIVRGVQWVVDHQQKHEIRVLNLSFAAPPRWPYWLDPINQSLMKAWAAGITVVAAAGNEGPEPMTVGSPGNLPYIITVGAVTDSWTLYTRDDDYVPDFSSQGPTPSAHIKPDIVAPGGHIIGITRPGATLTRQHPEYMLSTGNLVMTGTSQASAVVSGIAALLLQLEPDLHPDDVKCKLTSSAELAINRDGLLAYTPFQQGNGYVSASRAVTLGQRGCGNSDLDINLDIAGKQHYQGPAIVEEDGAVSLPGLNQMVAPAPSTKGLSDDRKWGVKEHIERPPPPLGQMSNNISPFDWEQRYLEEKFLIEKLSSTPPE